MDEVWAFYQKVIPWLVAQDYVTAVFPFGKWPYCLRIYCSFLSIFARLLGGHGQRQPRQPAHEGRTTHRLGQLHRSRTLLNVDYAVTLLHFFYTYYTRLFTIPREGNRHAARNLKFSLCCKGVCRCCIPSCLFNATFGRVHCSLNLRLLSPSCWSSLLGHRGYLSVLEPI